MILSRRFPPQLFVAIFLRFALVSGLWAALVYVLYAFADLRWLRIPFLPISTIGTAVAFYIGFKNNSAYERFWEGRKIWGAVVNSSRTWAVAVQAYVDAAEKLPETEETHRRLIYRHLAWINGLRIQLRKTSRFFDRPARSTRLRLERHAEHMRNDWDKEISPFLAADEHEELKQKKNAATQMLRNQGLELAELVREGRLDLFRQLELMKIIEEFYTLQGKCERIKNTPFPRQYAEFSRIFTRFFVVLVPFGLLDVFADHVAAGTVMNTWTPVIPMIVASVLISIVFNTIEGVGDSSEDPFERSMNDVPMNALCRAIEIDLREMLGETDLPPKETDIDRILY